jgi:hypothetical protein
VKEGTQLSTTYWPSQGLVPTATGQVGGGVRWGGGVERRRLRGRERWKDLAPFGLCCSAAVVGD